MKNWILINNEEAEHLINLSTVSSISRLKTCKDMHYLSIVTNDIEFPYTWTFSSNEECDSKYCELIEELTNLKDIDEGFCLDIDPRE